MAWVSPTGFVDPDSKWITEEKAYDDDIVQPSYAQGDNIPYGTWGSFIELTHSAIWCSKVRFFAYMGAGNINKIDIDIYYDSSWHDFYEGDYLNQQWDEQSAIAAFSVTKVRFRFYNSAASGAVGTLLYEVDFDEAKTAPGVTIQTPTDILSSSVTANGNLLTTGGETVTEWGFEYGLTKTNTWEVHTTGTGSVGAYTKAITGLSANTSYWVRAYATNSVGKYTGEWIQFQTAAAGTIPTGTKLDICADYSGYTYQLQRSETDDGEAYTAYFVISTDLSNKQSLAIYKRILDLWLYFNSESSGTATITVKRDNEADWQAVGSVDLTGTADIIVKHLATRIYGKHFLFKISAANHFEFLGCLFEFLPKGMR